MYKEASRLNLKFDTVKGPLTVSQLWTLELETLDTLAVSLEEEYNNGKGKSFLDTKTTKDKTVKLKLDLVLDVLQTKVDEASKLRDAKEIKEHNAKIIEMIKDKQNDALKGKSIKELEKLLK